MVSFSHTPTNQNGKTSATTKTMKHLLTVFILSKCLTVCVLKKRCKFTKNYCKTVRYLKHHAHQILCACLRNFLCCLELKSQIIPMYFPKCVFTMAKI